MAQEWHEETTADGDVYVYPPDGNYYNRYLVGNGNYTNGLRRDHVRLFVNAARMLAALESVEWAFDACGNELCPWCMNEHMEGHAHDCPRQVAIAAARGLEE